MKNGQHLSFWTGEIHSIDSPYQGGEVQIRIYGSQDNTAAIPDDSLRWARVAYPTTAGQQHGSGVSHGLSKGTKVIGVYLDEDEQIPMVMFSHGASGDVTGANTASAPMAAKTKGAS